MHIRPAEERDCATINDIRNYYIVHTPITFDLETEPVEARIEWFTHYHVTGRHRLFVSETDGNVTGYAYTSQFRSKAAYDTTVEMTIYLAPEAVGRGIGSVLYATLFDALRDEDVHLAVAGITLPNEASIALHKKFGFEDVGVYHEVGRKFGKYWDVVWMEKRLG